VATRLLQCHVNEIFDRLILVTSVSAEGSGVLCGHREERGGGTRDVRTMNGRQQCSTEVN